MRGRRGRVAAARRPRTRIKESPSPAGVAPTPRSDTAARTPAPANLLDAAPARARMGAMFDVCVIGHVTRDIIAIKGRPAKPMPGGTAY